MSFKHNSWGRTRQPKAASGRSGDKITGSLSLADLNIMSYPDDFLHINGIYRTENQRYAHIACSGSSTVSNVYTYNYAMGYWHELKTVNPTDGTRDSIAVGNNECIIVDINGSDWISIKSGSLSVVTMAFSTF